MAEAPHGKRPRKRPLRGKGRANTGKPNRGATEAAQRGRQKKPEQRTRPRNDLGFNVLLSDSVRTCLDVNESRNRRLGAIAKIQVCMLDGERHEQVREMYGKVFSTLEQLLHDPVASIRSAVASALGALATALGEHNHIFLQWAFSSLKNSCNAVAYKQLCIFILSAYFNFAKEYVLHVSLPHITASFSAFLNDIPTEQCDLMAPTIDLLLQLAEWPQFLEPHFDGIAETLMVWAVDVQTPSNLQRRITTCFVNLRPLWTDDLRLMLLDQLVTDTESLAAYKETTHAQLSRFVRIFGCAVTLCENRVPKHSTYKEAPGILELVVRLIASSARLRRYAYDSVGVGCLPLWVYYSNRCLQLLAHSVQRAAQYHAEILDFALEQLTPTPTVEIILSVLHILERLWNQLSLAAAQLLLRPGSAFLKLRVHPEPRIKLAVLNLVRACVDLRILADHDQSRAPETYTDLSFIAMQCISVEMQQLAAQLKSTIDPNLGFGACQLLEWDANLLSLVATSADCASASSALQTLSENLDPFSPEFSCRSRLQFALLRTFLSLHRRLGFPFTLNGDVVLKCVPLALKRTARSEITMLAIEWLEEIFQCPHELHRAPANLAICFDELAYRARSAEPVIRLSVARCLRWTLCVANDTYKFMHPLQLSRFARIAASAIADPFVSVQRAYKNILMSTSPTLLLGSQSNAEQYTQQSRSWKCQLLCTSSPQIFTASNFMRLMHMLAQRGTDDLEEWFHRSLQSTILDGWEASQDFAGQVRSLSAIDHRVGEYWVLLECARFCITSRLRTPLGGPVQTFEKFESILAAIASSATIGFGLDAAKLGAQACPMVTGPQRKRVGAIRAARLMVECIDLLEKHVYNGYEGVVNLPEVSASCLKFFAGNRKVCEDWFARIRTNMAICSMICHMFEASVRYSFQCVRRTLRSLGSGRNAASGDKKRCWQDVEVHLLRAGRALCTHRAADSVRGVVLWSRALLKSKFKEIHSCTLSWLDGLVAHTQGRYEQAIVEYLAGLVPENLQHMQPCSVQFLVDQLTECYVTVGDWCGLSKWLKTLKSYRMQYASSDLQRSFYPVQDINFLNALCAVDSGDFVSAAAHLDLIPVCSNDSVHIANRLHDSDVVSLRLMVSLALGTSNPYTMAQMAQAATRSLSEPLQNSSTSIATNVLVQLRCLQILENGIESVQTWGVQSNPQRMSGHLGDCAIYSRLSLANEPESQEIGPWLKLLRTLKVLVKCGLTTQTCELLSLPLSKLARKQQNFQLSMRLLDASGDSMLATYNRAQLLYDQNERSMAVQLLWNLTRQFHEISNFDVGVGRCKLHAKALLKLAGWLLKDSAVRIQGILDIVAAPTDLGVENHKGMANTLNRAAGDLIIQATLTAPAYSKAWLRHAAWCYENYNKSVNGNGSNDQFCLTECEKSSIEALVQRTVHTGAVQGGCARDVGGIFQQHGQAIQNQDSGMDTVHRVHAADMRSDLTTCFNHVPMPMETVSTVVEELMALWAAVRRRMLHPYSMAAQSFFRYLHVSSSNRTTAMASDNSANESKMLTLAFDCDDRDIMVTLRLLRLLVKHGTDLEDVLSDGLESTPIAPWSAIIPQLFARVGHPDAYVRRQVHTLITRIGKESPHLIIWPGIVGYESDGVQDDGSQSHLEQLFDMLATTYPDLIRDARSMIAELVRITVLWEELWVGALHNVQSDAMNRVRRLKDELLRVSQNISLSY
eukprot:COSAG01_NODE_3405_length_6131_cov_7.388926_1_plen_1714_part_10